MKHFLDIGANDSCSARIFRKMFDQECKWMITSMEVEPNFIRNFDDIKYCVPLNVAAWDEYGEMEFHRDVRDGRKAGGTLMNKKGEWSKEESITVKTIDLSDWIQKSFQKTDTIWLKLDVEGAEYKIIPKMFNDGTLDWIDTLSIEWHWYKLEGMTEKEHNKISKMIEGVKQVKWPGIENAQRILGNNYLKE